MTLLFTDIVDSTGVVSRLGDQRWTDLLGSHDQRIADAVDLYRGHVVKLTGDGVLAVFDGAARAIRCALACQQVAEDLDLSIRTAVHTGEVELAGDEIRGLAVHEASRMMSQAEAGEVLVSEFTKAFASDPQLQFEDKGNFTLRGLDEPVRLHSVSN